MRRLVLILVLANVLMFGWSRGWFGGAGETALSAGDVDAQRLRPVPLSRLEVPDSASSAPLPSGSPPAAAQPSARRAAPPAAPTSDSAPDSAPLTSAAPRQAAHGPPIPAPTTPEPSTQAIGTPAAATPEPTTAEPGTQDQPADAVPAPDAHDAGRARAADPSASASFAAAACRAFAPLDEERATALRSALEQSGARVEARRIEQGASYLVYLPPAAGAAEAQQRLVDVRRIGRDDAFVIQDGPMRLAISLGLFRYESAARAMVDQLARAGETRALVAPRPPIQVRIALQARWPQAEGAAIAAMLGAQFDAPARDCD